VRQINDDDIEVFQCMQYAVLPTGRVLGSPNSVGAQAVPIAFTVSEDLAFNVAKSLSAKYEKENPACAGCAAFGEPVWEGEINPGMNRTDEGWYHYTGGIHPFKDKYIWCVAKNKQKEKSFVEEEIDRLVGPYDEIPDRLDAGEVVYTVNGSSLADRKLMGLKFALKANIRGDGGKTVANTKILSDDWNLLMRIKNLINKPVKADIKMAPVLMGKDTVDFHLKCLAGRILTLVDAMVTSEAQNKAFKTYIKKEFREQYRRSASFFNPDDNCAQPLDHSELEIAEREQL